MGERLSLDKLLMGLLLVAGWETALSETRERATETSTPTVQSTNTHTDKTEFLSAVSLLGRSAEDGKAVLGKMIGKLVEPIVDKLTSPGGFKVRYHVSVPILSDDRIAASTTYGYGIRPDGAYAPSVSMYLLSIT